MTDADEEHLAEAATAYALVFCAEAAMFVAAAALAVRVTRPAPVGDGITAFPAEETPITETGT